MYASFVTEKQYLGIITNQNNKNFKRILDTLLHNVEFIK